MSDTAFTPAPWYLDGGFVYSARNRDLVKAAKAKDRNCGDGNIPLAKVIADMAGEYQANANLIAAAPDMFEALERLCRNADELDRHGLPDEFDAADRALAKARGES